MHEMLTCKEVCTTVGLVRGLEGDNYWFQFQLVLFNLELDLIFEPGCRTRTFFEKLDQELDSRFHLCVGLEPELEPKIEKKLELGLIRAQLLVNHRSNSIMWNWNRTGSNFQNQNWNKEQDLELELEFTFLKNQNWNQNLSNLFLEQELRFLVRVKNCPTLVYSRSLTLLICTSCCLCVLESHNTKDKT
jgi:hypothetical protein